jgi:hypothetical protein
LDVIAAAAARVPLTVLHYDRNFEHIVLSSGPGAATHVARSGMDQ